MLHGDLSHLRQRGASSFRGSWRSSGSWRQGRDQIIKKDDEKPLGRLVAEVTLEGITSSAVGAVEARVTNCAYAASYSLNDEKPRQVIVPGQPPTWRPPPLPCRLPGDHGDYLRDQNGARFPDYPIQPAVQALFALNEAFDPASIDVMGCASSLGDILRFARSIDSTFRLDTELVGNTLFLIRNHKSDVIPDVRGYGHSFLKAFTSSDPDSGKTESHQRVVSYDFAGLKCLVRFECDGYLPRYDGHETLVAKPEVRLPSPAPDSIVLREAGMIVPQGSVLEIKTKSKATMAIQKNDHLPRLWVRQIPQFITAYHDRGSFQDVHVTDVCQELAEWEIEHQDELKMFASTLRQLITEVRRSSHLKLEIRRAGTGPLQLRERTETASQALPSSWRDRWAAGPGRSPVRLTNSEESDEDSDEGSEAYPSARLSFEGSDGSEPDFSFDYTACSAECGYCGHCA
ncbi:hypothetical protein F5Y14DRAFT_55226 [Nemania sp. NC0429]|nr:hypothetical protein F5Y14DRAFT_55226 [Nemania sp. NC0429]